MDKLFWVIPGKLAGRPGPDTAPWNLGAFHAGGIGAVLSVNDGFMCDAEDFAVQGINYACVPLSDKAPPQPGDEQICRSALPKAYAFVAAQIAERHKVVVHCSGGADRTGLFLCYFLMQHENLSPAQAIKKVRQVRPVALSATGWEHFAKQVLASFE